MNLQVHSLMVTGGEAFGKLSGQDDNSPRKGEVVFMALGDNEKPKLAVSPPY